MPELLFLIPSLERAPYMMALLNQLAADSRFRTTVVTSALPDGVGHRFEWIPVPATRTIGRHSGRTTPWFSLPPSTGIRIVARRRPAVVFSVGFGFWSVAAGILRCTRDFTLIVLYDGSSPTVDGRQNVLRRIQRRLLARRVDLFLANSRGARAYLSGVVSDQSKIVQSYYLVPLRIPESATARSKVRGDGLEISYLGRVQDTKGVEEMLDAVTRLPSDAAWTLTLVGDGPMSDWVTLEAERRGIAERVVVTGWLEHTQALTAVAESDVMLYLSREDVWAVGVLEALSLGVPVICAQTVGAAELIHDGVNGYVVGAESGSAGELLEKLIDSPELVSELAVGARESMSGLGPAEAAADIASLVDRVVGCFSKEESG